MSFISSWINTFHSDRFASMKSVEEDRHRIFVYISLIGVIPVLGGYGLLFWLEDNKLFDSLINFSLAVSFLVIAVLMKTTTWGRNLYRCGMAGLAFLLVYNVGFGPNGESEALWLLVYPLAAFYLFGAREGLIWISAIIIPSGLMICFAGPLKTNFYPVHFRIALTIAVMITVALSFLFEFLRSYFYNMLEKKNEELQMALTEVKTLSGLFPICASCKKIRDDTGYWNQIESYISERSEAKFSHGICPECLEELYPDLDPDDETHLT